MTRWHVTYRDRVGRTRVATHVPAPTEAGARRAVCAAKSLPPSCIIAACRVPPRA